MPLLIRMRTCSNQNNGELIEKIDNLTNVFKPLKEDIRKKTRILLDRKEKKS